MAAVSNAKFLLSNLPPSSQNKHLFSFSFVSQPSTYLPPPRVPPLCFARRRPINKKKSRSGQDINKNDDLGEDAFEALFKQLEEDLKNDGQFSDDGEDEISEEDLALLERELEEALAEDEDMSQLLNRFSNDATESGGTGIIDVLEDKEEEEEVVEEEDEEDNDDDNEEEEPLKLRGWQLRRLAHALKAGRRKTSIKNLAAELCLDRAVVLELLRDPPPNLLMMSATLPDKPKPPITVPVSEATPVVTEVGDDSAEPEPKDETPMHVMQGSWSAQKRLKKAHINTLESVYRRSKRPTNAMINSIVQVTNLPRRRVVKWFEDKRAADGVPEQRRPYQRSSSPSVLANQ